MQRYNFDKEINRRDTNCVKYDTMPDAETIALWVADMDFETAPVITDALKARMEHGCFGYTHVPDSYYEATTNWFSRRHGWAPDPRWFIYTSGVVPAISAIIKAMTMPGEKVLVQTPVYNCFFSSIRNNGCEAELAELTYVKGDNTHEPTYTIDFEDFERRCEDEKVTLFILCNPHNPAGRVWSAEELKRMGEICKRHGVFVIADEIHCEFTNGVKYTPFASVSDAPCAVCVSPSKAFNIAGLQIANIICSNGPIRRRIDRAININETCDVNPFGVIALQKAYTKEGEEWFTQLNDYINGNDVFVREYLKENLPAWKPVKREGTYLMWIDISATGMDGDQMESVLLKDANVAVMSGVHYGQEAGKNFIRVNLATQRARLKEALDRITSRI